MKRIYNRLVDAYFNAELGTLRERILDELCALFEFFGFGRLR